ncbi:MAG: hypothetical protein JSV88_20915 [Candidatus Aminicenantes bacterium]|nr:MAG: hypothetical protein JSV88_20915 [Candidatus Aminicenantes bacterium]
MTQHQLVSKNPIVRKIVSGEAKPEMLDLLIAKQLPFTEEEYLESLVFVIKDERLKSGAMEQLKNIPGSTKSNYIEKSHANHRAAYFIILEALSRKNSNLVAKAILNQALPYEFLVKIAEKADASQLELLLDNQIKLIAYPEIMEVMEKNPKITNYIKGKIKEIREFYLLEDKAEEIPAEEVLEDVKEVIVREQQQKQEEGMETEEKEEEEEELGDLRDDVLEEKALTTLQEINNMSISDRIKLAFTGAKTHRMILVKDPNKMVALSVLESPKITIDEVVILAKNKSIATDIIGRVARNREWIKNYSVIVELVQNPKTPVKSALSFINRLHLRDLKLLSHNKNTNPVIREFAANLFSQRVRTVKKK